MTDLMLRPDDTGEIKIRGDRTQLLRVPADLAPPAVDRGEATTRLTPPPRRPAADDTGEILYRADRDAPATVGDLDARSGCRRVELDDEDLLPSPPTAPPPPLPSPPPAPKPADDQGAVAWMWVGNQVRWLGQPTPTYAGQHRRPSLLARLTGKRGNR